MQIEWKHMWLSFIHEGSTIKLSSINDDPVSGPEVTVNQLSAMTKSDAIWGVVEVYAVKPDAEVTSEVPTAITQLVS